MSCWYYNISDRIISRCAACDKHFVTGETRTSGEPDDAVDVESSSSSLSSSDSVTKMASLRSHTFFMRCSRCLRCSFNMSLGTLVKSNWTPRDGDKSGLQLLFHDSRVKAARRFANRRRLASWYPFDIIIDFQKKCSELDFNEIYKVNEVQISARSILYSYSK